MLQHSIEYFVIYAIIMTILGEVCHFHHLVWRGDENAYRGEHIYKALFAVGWWEVVAY